MRDFVVLSVGMDLTSANLYGSREDTPLPFGLPNALVGRSAC